MNDARKITHETRTGDRAWAIAWVIADGRGCNSPSARFFSAMNDRRYEILIDGELLVDPISQLTADVTVVSEYNCITDYLETLRLGDRSEEHTSELQSLMRISYAVFCLKKKNT